MNDLLRTAPAFVEMAHAIVWCSVATVDRAGRPRSRVLHPIWQWDGDALGGWVGSTAAPTMRAHLEHSAYVSCNYWVPSQDTCVAECHAEWVLDDRTRAEVWDVFKSTPEPLGYDPAGIGVPGWHGPTSSSFAALRLRPLRPWRLRVFWGSLFTSSGEEELLTWQE